jgi:hypothetical protein
MTRAEQLRAMTPQLVVDVRLYQPDEGGRRSTAFPGWGCVCMVSDQPPWEGWDGWPLLEDQTLEPGDERRLGFVFLSPEAPDIMRSAGRFFLWEGRVVGEAAVVG